ncbi:MAG: response regulator [Bacteroidales bacterium]|nr:response regulator [Bacteroidales bacterium]
MAGVLIVEDDAALRELLRDSLEKRKYTVITAADGREALAKFRPSVVDLVITDLLMPEEDGLMVIMKIKEMKPSTRLIAISGGGKGRPGKLPPYGQHAGRRPCLLKAVPSFRTGAESEGIAGINIILHRLLLKYKLNQ